MLKPFFQLLPFVCFAGSVWAANDAFVGTWKVDPSKSTLYDEMRIEAVGTNRYSLTLGPGAVDTVVADGNDQPALSGSTLSISVSGSHTWEVVRKMKGRMLIKAHWTLSEDGKTLTDDFTQYLPDGMTLFSQSLPNGSMLILPYVYERTAGNSGFLGTWDSQSAKVKAGTELQVSPYEADGLSFKRSDEDKASNIKLDGKDHPNDSNGTDRGTAYAVHRESARSLEITYKTDGKTTVTRLIELSPDLKTLMLTERLVGQSKPKSILVFDRE